MADPLELDEAAYAVWQHLTKLDSAGVEKLVQLTGLDQSKVIVVATDAAEKGLLTIQSHETEELIPTDNAADAVRQDLPERRAAELLANNGGTVSKRQFIELAKGAGITINEAFKWGEARGWIQRGKDDVKLTDAGEKVVADGTRDADECLLLEQFDGPIFLDQVQQGQRAAELLRKRPELAKIKKRTRRTLTLTDAGRAAASAGISVRHQRTALTPDDLRSGAWREITLRPYDVTLPAETIHTAKTHPLRKIIEQTRRAFLEMGFTEVVSPMVESSFWNFDALFQPQDHPARDMQDTFYMDEPREVPLPDDKKLDERVKRVHEDGGDTGSDGWGYKWDPQRAMQTVLRTHTTAATLPAPTIGFIAPTTTTHC